LSTVDFEITLSALLATTLLAYPVENHGLFGQITAFSLLSLTLIRRMAITSPFAPEEKILRRTTPIISFASSCAIIYFFVTVLPVIAVILPISSGIITFSVFTFAILTFLITAQELVFHDYLAWWYVKFKQKSEEHDILETVWQDAATISYWASSARRSPENYRELGDRITGSRPNLDDFDFTTERAARYMLSTSLLVTMLYLIPTIYSIVLFGVSGILVIPAMVAIHDNSAFWYIAYGAPSYEDLRQHVLVIIIRSMIYITILSFLHPRSDLIIL